MTKSTKLFDKNTRAIIYGLQAKAIQRMLDFDSLCEREKPSVAAVVSEGKGGYNKAFWKGKEILLPVYKTISDACQNHPDTDVMINFASFRSAFETTKAALEEEQLNTVVMIAEGVPERQSRILRQMAKEKGKWIIGPATVGGITAGAFKIGNTGGTIENIIESGLFKQGQVGFVSKSGGLSNEAYNIINRNTNGVYEGVAVGGDANPGSTLFEHVMRFEKNDDVKMIVVLGEVGGRSEYEIVDALKNKTITKPVVAWVTGTCAKIFPASIQFGHAGAKADSKEDQAEAKNLALKEAGAIVPESFNDFDVVIRETYEKLLKQNIMDPVQDITPKKPPMDYNAALAQGLVQRKTNFTSTISDDRGEELTYAGVPISQVIESGMGLGDVIGLLWFKKKFPKFAAQFIELVLVITADHGPAVSGAHNAIVTARAGKDLMSSVASGILTIGPRFGGAVSGAAQMFKEAMSKNLSPVEMVKHWRKQNINIQGIGHRIKSLRNPDKRVELLKDFAKKNFPKTEHLDYALSVEEITTQKKDTLILNVDGCIGVLFLDLMDAVGFGSDEINQIVADGGLNGLFVLGRTIGFIGHYFDQKRLKDGLYRHPWDDVLYM